MCWKCDAVRAARGDGPVHPDAYFDIDVAMVLDYAQRHGVTVEQAEDAFIFAAAAIQPSRARH
jgi:hypothetical protein